MGADRARGDAPEIVEAGLRLPESHEVWRAVHAATQPLMVERLRTALYLVLIPLSFFLVQDLLCFPDRTATLLPIKVFQFSLVAAALWWLRSGRTRGNAVAFALCLCAVFGFCATAAGIVRGVASGTALLFIVVTAGTAIGFPWGARAQAVLVGICAILLAWNDYANGGTLASVLAGPATGSMLTAGLVSVFVAHSVERYRWQIQEREMGLRRREEHFRSLIENGGDLIVVVGADGLVHYASPSVQRLLGYASRDWIGASFFSFIHPEDVARLRAAMAASKPAGGPVHGVEVRLRDASAAWYVLDGTIANLLTNVAVRGFVFNARDITQRRRMEIDLRRHQAELTHVLRLGTIGEMASTLAHEINQPLAAIANYASACARRLNSGGGSPSELQRGLQLIAAEALRAGRIVHGLGEISRKGDGSMEMIDLNGVVRSAVELIEPQARELGIALRLDASAGLPQVCADGVQIEQVVLNLLLNGIESMHASPVKVLRATTARVDEHVEVRVCDTGSGLDPAVADRVFEPFFTTKPTGLGMGLAISRRIIEAHGGGFSGVANPDGGGSTFAFSLPLPASAAPSMSA